MVYYNTYWHSKFRVSDYPWKNARPLNNFSAFLLRTLPPFFENHFLKKLFWFSSEKMKNEDRATKCIAAARTLTMPKPKNKNVFKKNAKMRRIAFCSETFFGKFFILLNSLICTLLLISITYFLQLFTKFGFFLLTYFLLLFAFWLRKMYSKFVRHEQISTQSKKK